MKKEMAQKFKLWLSESYDKETRAALQRLIDEQSPELEDAFYTDLEFGTGGLRGIMGIGTNRMNRYTVGFATQGMANYLKKRFTGEIKVVIAYDSRLNSRFFAEITADIFSANHIFCYLFEDIRPTPELSYAIRELGCKAGVMITASHNPKEYNGYKAYWEDGGQLVFPDDKNVTAEVKQVTQVEEVQWNRNEKLVKIIGEEIDEHYLDRVQSLSLNPEIIKQSNLSIVYTPLHGAGANLVPQALRRFGFNNIHFVKEQMIPDGMFPTVASPNPEEETALAMALQKANAVKADLILATDPDADRVGVAYRTANGQYELLNGNMTASLLIYYLLSQRAIQKHYGSDDFIVKTIVTTELLRKIAIEFNIECYDVLTGFKYIAEMIRKKENKATFVGGGEESCGYLVGDFVRDKDAVSACCLIAEMAAFFKSNHQNLHEALLEIYKQFGFYKQKMISVTKKGMEGALEIKKIMISFREMFPEEICGSKIVYFIDYQTGKIINRITGNNTGTQLPQSDVLQFILEDETKITVRPSGTEPKIKFYVEARGELLSDFQKSNDQLEIKLNTIIKELLMQ
ncbi:MAG: phospho-sugar mutase [Bacteroidales bacterium]|jgi:phosphoglucomutase|nr:phospho-sugar mutase [Bacteroidales bacterium]